ncbi:hypothetical protein GOV05_01560 [Candidatus Woesearchaeota archaeon]|nr:hypothetical protein [Candidatus Woesearchaeota archaeon]
MKNSKIRDPEYLSNLKITIKHLFKFDSDGYSDNFLERRLSARLADFGISSYRIYDMLLRRSELEQKKLLKSLTVHVTEFFRDKSFWEFGKIMFFKGLIELYQNNHRIKVWSAGCSSGQEPISILIAFLELDKNVYEKLEIIATDVNHNILSYAKKYTYDEFETKGMSKEILEKYFDKKDESYTLKKEYQRKINYFEHDILNDPPIKNVQVLFCRNTVIYFSMAAKEKLYAKLYYESLRNPGYFVMGKTEGLLGEAKDLFKAFDLRERIFEKN